MKSPYSFDLRRGGMAKGVSWAVSALVCKELVETQTRYRKLAFGFTLLRHHICAE